jgi:2-polyprenyl-6-methoxyphenol hydroxylase-like FAD-dependent oxidoreductase
MVSSVRSTPSGLSPAAAIGQASGARGIVHRAQHEGRVIAYFGDASTAEGHVLVGADGIRSAGRAQRAPYADTVDAGVQA